MSQPTDRPARKFADVPRHLYKGYEDTTQPETSAPPALAQDDLGLSIDMLDADRLREWARLLLVHGADISHWASVPHVAGKLQTLATGIEHAVRDIGALRQHIEGLTRQLAERCYTELQYQHAQKQAHANGFQVGWHSVLSRYAQGDAPHELVELVPLPASPASPTGPQEDR